LSASKSSLTQDFKKASCYDQSFCFKAIYEREFGTPGGQPYSLLLADYHFNHSDSDLALLQGLAGVGSASFCPIITGADPSLFGFNDWQSLSKPRSLATIFDSQDYAAWRSFRASDDSRFITLTMPRVLARANHSDGKRETLPCWMNAAYPLAARIGDAMRTSGWPVAIRGAENGGKVYNLPLAQGCSTEVAITDRREAELSQLGFLPLCHYKNTNFAVFFGSQTSHLPARFDNDNATANAAIAARLPYLLTSSRIAHYLKVMARDKMGSFLEISDAERWLNQWILSYVNGNPNSKQALKAKYPLAEAHIKVTESTHSPGTYEATAWLRPWLQFEELTTSMRLVARLPQGK
jgi:type VI secretion system protein ImpC